MAPGSLLPAWGGEVVGGGTAGPAVLSFLGPFPPFAGLTAHPTVPWFLPVSAAPSTQTRGTGESESGTRQSLGAAPPAGNSTEPPGCRSSAAERARQARQLNREGEIDNQGKLGSRSSNPSLGSGGTGWPPAKAILSII